MGKVIRIGKQETLDKYKDELLKLAMKHVKKNNDFITADDIVDTFKLGCNDNDRMNCVLEEEDKLIGFIACSLQHMRRELMIVIEDFYCPNDKVNFKFRDTVVDKFKEVSGAKRCLFFTIRNPEAWVKFLKRGKPEYKIYGHLLVEDIGGN